MLRTPIVTRSIFLSTALVFAGCLEYDTTTTVHPDGTFTRSLVIKGDSASLYTWDLRVPVDSTWTVKERSRIEEKKWTMTAERPFSSSDEWNTWQRGLPRRVVQSEITVERKMRLFTIDYRFTETVKTYNPFTSIPITDFISESELSMFLRFEVLKEDSPSRGDSLALEGASDRFQEWEARTRVESFFGAIQKHLRPDAKVSSARLNELKESLVQRVLKGKENDLSVTSLRSWARSTGEGGIRTAVEAAVPDLEILEADLEYVKAVGSDSYTSHILLPGEITSTNGQLEGRNGAIWKDYIAYAYVKDFTMHASSSVVNVAAIVLTLSLIVGIPILTWVGWMVRRRRRQAKEDR